MLEIWNPCAFPQSTQNGQRLRNAIPMKGVLHLKSVCTALDDHTVLVNPRHFDTAEFSEYRLVAVPADESMAANVLRINGTVCMHAGFHQTADLLRTQGFDIKTVDISE